MDLLATVAELRLFLEDDTLDADRAELFLRLASGEARGYTGNGFDWIEDDVVRLNGTGTSVLLLPEAPVADVSELVQAVGLAAELILEGPVDTSPAWEWDEDGVIERIDGGVFARRRRHYQITYSHGFEVVPDEVKAVVLRVAARGFESPDGIRQEALGRYSYTLAGEAAGMGLYAPDRRDLDPYFVSTKMRAGTAAAGSGS